MKSILSLIKNCDAYGANFTFKIQDSSSIKTIAGGIMTIITFLCYIFAFFVFGNDLINKRNPKLLIQTKVLSENQYDYLNTYNITDKMLVVMVNKELNSVLNWMIDAIVPFSFSIRKAI